MSDDMEKLPSDAEKSGLKPKDKKPMEPTPAPQDKEKCDPSEQPS